MFHRNNLTLLLYISFATTLPLAAFSTPALNARAIASQAYVDTKQSEIPIDKVLLREGDGKERPDVYVPGVVVTNAAGTALSGDTVGIVTGGDLSTAALTFSDIVTGGSTYNNFVPTLLATATALVGKQDTLPAKLTTGELAPVGGTAVALGTAGSPEYRYITAGAGDALTLNDKAPAVMKYVNGTTDLATFALGTFGKDGEGQQVLDAIVSLELLADVYNNLQKSLYDLSNNTVNGAPISNQASYYFDPAGGGAADTVTKTVNIPSITSAPTVGMIITVQPTTTTALSCGKTCKKLYLNLNNTGPIPIYYKGGEITDPATAASVWNENYPSTFVYTEMADAGSGSGSGTPKAGGETNPVWLFMGNGTIDTDTTYSAITSDSSGDWSGPAGTGTTPGVISPSVLKTTIQNTKIGPLLLGIPVTIDANTTVNNAFARLQNQITAYKIGATSDGTGGTPNYVYNANTNQYAAGSVVTTTTTAGTTGQVGIATAPTYTTSNNVTTLTNGDWIPTMSALMDQISTATDTLSWNNTFQAAINAYSTTFDSTSTHTNGNWPYQGEDKLVNGTTLANALSLKQNKITPSTVTFLTGTEAEDGGLGIVTANLTATELTGSDFGVLTGGHLDLLMNFVDGSAVPFVYGLNYANDDFFTNTTGLNPAELEKFVPTIGAVGNALHEIDLLKQNKIAATSDGTDNTPNYVYNANTNQYAAGSVVTTTTTAGTTGQVGIATAPTYDNSNNLTNGDWLPTMGAVMTAISSHVPTGTQNTIANYDANGALGTGIATYDASGTYNAGTDAGKIATAAAVETRVSKTQSTGSQVLTTGTNGTVTTEYISVPVTTSGTGKPTANNAPTGAAAMWIE